MAKIVLSMDGVILQEMVLAKERITIGRRLHNDLVIDNSAISAEHAVIVSMLRDAYLEDLNSTNGTRVNGQPIKKHFLKNNDTIELAKYKIRFVSEHESPNEIAATIQKSPHKSEDGLQINPNRAVEPQRIYRDGNTVMLAESVGHDNAIIKILSGSNTGKEISLSKPLTTIGLPGQQVAVVTRRNAAYSITHVEGETYPIINGKSIGPGAYTMVSGDRIELAQTQMEFLLR